MNNETNGNEKSEARQRQYELAKRRLCKALDEIAADNVEAPMSFAALVDLVVDWSMQQGGKRMLWDAVGLMHTRLEELQKLADSDARKAAIAKERMKARWIKWQKQQTEKLRLSENAKPH